MPGADRRPDGDHRGRRRQQHIDHHRLGSDFDHRQLLDRYGDGGRDGAGPQYALLTLTGSADLGHRAGRGYRGRFADRRADGDDRGCGRQWHQHHDRLGGDLDHRQLQYRHRDGERDGAGQQYRADAGRLCGGGGDRPGRRSRCQRADRRPDGDDRRRRRQRHHDHHRLGSDLDHRQLRRQPTR